MKSSMTEIIDDLKLQFNNLDSNQKKVDTLAASFLKYAKEDEDSIEDLIRLWQHFFFINNSTNKISFILLANIIIQSSKENNLCFHTTFFNYIVNILPLIYKEASEHDKKEINKIIDQWISKGIFEDEQKIKDLKNFVTLVYNKALLDNPIFNNLVTTGKIKISPKIIELCEAQDRLNESVKNMNASGLDINSGCTVGEKMDIDSEGIEGKMNNKVINTENVIAEQSRKGIIENSISENKHREALLKLLSEKVKEQFQNNIKELMLLEEVDNMLHKIKSIKKNSAKSK